MKAYEIVNAARYMIADRNEPYPWPDAELMFYLNDAINELCRECLLIFDNKTPDICHVSVTSTQTDYALDGRIIMVVRARLASDGRGLVRTYAEKLDLLYTGWEALYGRPRQYLFDSSSKTLRLFPMPTTDDTLHLSVYRMPLNDITLNDKTVTPEIAFHYHYVLVNGILARAFAKPDLHTYDENKAKVYKNIWLETLENIKREKARAGYSESTFTVSGGAI